MTKKILKLCRDTNVVWVFDEDANEGYQEATLIYGVTHITPLIGDICDLYNGKKIVGMQFGVKEIREEW